MTDQTHPITPPPELVSDWAHMLATDTDTYVFTQAARWGGDQELEECCKWVFQKFAVPTTQLRSYRRPKPPSLKEQALGLLNEGPVSELLDHEVEIIRLALEQLSND